MESESNYSKSSPQKENNPKRFKRARKPKQEQSKIDLDDLQPSQSDMNGKLDLDEANLQQLEEGGL